MRGVAYKRAGWHFAAFFTDLTKASASGTQLPQLSGSSHT